jgi:predicted phosphoribosyltransferase
VGNGNNFLPGVELAFRQGKRYPVVDVFRPIVQNLNITAGAQKVTVVEQKFPVGSHGFLTAIGHETTNVGWTDLTWRIVVDTGAVRGYGDQVGVQWGRLNNPGEVYAWVPITSTVRLVVDSAAATDEPVSATLVGYWWPEPEASK